MLVFGHVERRTKQFQQQTDLQMSDNERRGQNLETQDTFKRGLFQSLRGQPVALILVEGFGYSVKHEHTYAPMPLKYCSTGCMAFPASSGLSASAHLKMPVQKDHAGSQLGGKCREPGIFRHDVDNADLHARVHRACIVEYPEL